MGKKGRHTSRNNSQLGEQVTASPIDNLEGLSIEQLRLISQAAPIALQNRLAKSLTSESFEEVIKAQAFINEQKKHQQAALPPEIKSVLWNPSEIGFNGHGYKDPNNGIAFTTLNRMADIYVIKAIINTRIEQVQNYMHYSDDDQKPGYQIRKKRKLFDTGKKEELTPKEQKRIEYIINFLENGGETSKWDLEDTFQDFTRKVLRDSLALDQMCFEVTRSRDMKPKQFCAVDGALIRQLDTLDPRHKDMFENYRWHGHLPRYAMVWDSQIIRNPANDELVVYYPWELGYGVRNKTTNVLRNGYGCSELETLVEVITWILWGMQYNGNFFKQGSQPKGFINIKNANIDQGTLNEFRQDWKQTMSSVYNAHKTPVIQGIDMEWVDLQHSNKDMEFDAWVKFLIVITCAVYRIDPSELGFNFQDASNIFGQDGQRERLDHSKKKGLQPLLVFYQNILNKYIVSEIDDDFEFVFTGLDIRDEQAQVALDKAKLDAGVVALEDVFRKYNGRDLDPEKDTILNMIYQNALNAKMQGGDYSGGMADGGYGQAGGEGEEPEGDGTNWDDVSIDDIMAMKSQENPILGKAFEYINSQLIKK